jgi:hypothetical protein
MFDQVVGSGSKLVGTRLTIEIQLIPLDGPKATCQQDFHAESTEFAQLEKYHIQPHPAYFVIVRNIAKTAHFNESVTFYDATR